MVPITTQCPHCRAGGLSGMFCNNCRRYVSDATGTVERVTYTRRYFGDGWLGSISFIIMIATFPLGLIGGLIWLFFTAREAQSPAKKILNVYIIDAKTGIAVDAGRVWLRDVVVKWLLFNLVGGVLVIPAIINNAWVLFDPNRQALHDKIAGTLVVYAPNGLPPNMQNAEMQARTSRIVSAYQQATGPTPPEADQPAIPSTTQGGGRGET